MRQILLLSVVSALVLAAPASRAQDNSIKALRVAFSDFGSGGSHRPQRAALQLVGQGIVDRTVGYYKVLANMHHGESTFCVGANEFVTGRTTSLSKLYADLNKLKPRPGQMYGLTITPVESCDDEQ